MKMPKNRRAFALVLVLIALVISSSMAVFFLTSVARERLGVNLYATGAEVRHLAGIPVSQIIGQINAATKEGTAANPVSWASQPGMIRTYDTSGSAKSIYKLYSWNDMVESGASYDPSTPAQIPPKDWRNETAHYVDINQPVNSVYPIVDPRVEGDVEGFSIDEGNAVVGGADKERAPMPVKWLYVLEDGQMVAPSGGAGNLANIPGAGSGNPIIGRVAFWTDDETCKVNINTASEGAFWDVPRSGSRDDMQFAGNPLLKNEFQRTPGHPAMTSLSAVFPEIITENTSDSTQTRWGGQYATQTKKIFGMVPRLSWGSSSSPYQGSIGGTYPVPSYTYDYPPGRGSFPNSIIPRPIVLDADRLYVSADEFWFKPDHSANEGLKDNLTDGVQDLQRRLFFLTSSSRAPETTLFETPRISLWPITWPNASSYFPTRTAKNATLKAPTSFNDPVLALPSDPESKWITAEEKLLAFCGTLNTSNFGGGDRYYFQRKDPDSPLNDWDDTKATTTYDKRNRELVAYLASEMAKSVPGYGKSLQDSLGGVQAANWTGLNVFNYVRSQVNQYTIPNAYEGVRYSFTGVMSRQATIGTKVVGTIEEPNARVAVPIRASIDNKIYLPAATYPTLEEVAVVFYAAKRNEPIPPELPVGVSVLPGPGLNAGEPNPTDPLYPEWRNPFQWKNLINFTSSSYPKGAQTTVMRAVMLLDFAGGEPGVAIKPTFWVKVKGNSFRVNGTSIDLPSTSGLVAQCVLDSSATYTPVAASFYDKNGVGKIFSNKATPAANVWQLVSNDIPVNASDVEFSFSGTPITIEVYACNPSSTDTDPTNNETQKIYSKTMDFSKWSNSMASYPMPTAPRWTMTSRAYRFDANGAELTKSGNTAKSGTLPGGTKIKTEPVTTNPMVNFGRTIPRATPLGLNYEQKYDGWQPNPGYSAIPGAPAGLDTSWAWAEYAPIINSLSGTPVINDVRSTNSVCQGRADVNVYAYRGSVTDYSSSPSDLDDLLETTADLKQNISTNFRKRVEAVNQRNTNQKRVVFCLPGWSANPKGTGGLQSWQDANVMWTFPTNNSVTAELFLVSTETPLRENAPLLTPYDTVISMVNKPTSGTDDRDPRLALISSSAEFGDDNFDTIKNVMGNSVSPTLVISSIYSRKTERAQWHQFGTPGRVPGATGYRSLPSFLGKPFGLTANLTVTGTTGATPISDFGSLLGGDFGVFNKAPDTGDWTGMPGRFKDGGVLVRPDQEYQQLAQDTSGDLIVPYYPRDTYGDYAGGSAEYNTGTGWTSVSATDDLGYFSPNRQIPSPVLLGTMPRSMTAGWQTFAFSPNPANAGHPGLAAARPNAPDHLLLDLFWMPVAEPYPISDQLSTAGKVNLNYRLMPFAYITRQTALYAVMKNTWITAVTDNDNNRAAYKSPVWMKAAAAIKKTRYAIDVSQTLLAFEEIFKSNDLFRSASQLCEMFLVPKGQTLDIVRNLGGGFWKTNRLTSDNAREQPYNDLYSRVTTKSNTFTVHWRVQSLRKNPGTNVAVWDEARDRHVSELRGSTLIERYIDSNTKDDPATPSVNEGIPDYATATNPEPLTRYYKWRVVSENYFQP